MHIDGVNKNVLWVLEFLELWRAVNAVIVIMTSNYCDSTYVACQTCLFWILCKSHSQATLQVFIHGLGMRLGNRVFKNVTFAGEFMAIK